MTKKYREINDGCKWFHVLFVTTLNADICKFVAVIHAYACDTHRHSLCSRDVCKTLGIKARGSLLSAAHSLVTTSPRDIPAVPNQTPDTVHKVIR
jgi:hypothetical protein